MGRLIDADDVMEEWKVIPNFENYQISNIGRVKNSKTNKVIKQWHKGKYGHAMVGLYCKNKIFKKQVHRLVAEVFIENPNNYAEVCHIDNSFDEEGFLYNGVDNLEWGTHKYNCQFENTRHRQSINHANVSKENNPNYNNKWSEQLKEHMRIIKSEKYPNIIQCDDDLNIVNIFKSLKEAGRITKVCWVSIRNVCRKEYVHAGGYRWFYDYDYNNVKGSVSDD